MDKNATPKKYIIPSQKRAIDSNQKRVASLCPSIDSSFFVGNKETIELLSSYGWNKIESKNEYMISFRQEETNKRMNVYNTGTITIQNPTTGNGYGKCFVHKDIYSIEKLESIL